VQKQLGAVVVVLVQTVKLMSLWLATVNEFTLFHHSIVQCQPNQLIRCNQGCTVDNSQALLDGFFS